MNVSNFGVARNFSSYKCNVYDLKPLEINEKLECIQALITGCMFLVQASFNTDIKLSSGI
jgi:hypothetical protein